MSKQMTQDQLAFFRLRLQVQVRDFAIQQLIDAGRKLPNGDQTLKAWAQEVRARVTYQTFPNADPQLAQLVSSEYLDAVEEMLARHGL